MKPECDTVHGVACKLLPCPEYTTTPSDCDVLDTGMTTAPRGELTGSGSATVLVTITPATSMVAITRGVAAVMAVPTGAP